MELFKKFGEVIYPQGNMLGLNKKHEVEMRKPGLIKENLIPNCSSDQRQLWFHTSGAGGGSSWPEGALACEYRFSWIRAVQISTRKYATVPLAMEKF